VTFTELSEGVEVVSGFGLPGGYGCYIMIDRQENGTVGTMSVSYDNANILVFDN
jgi:hypothetical protein